MNQYKIPTHMLVGPSYWTAAGSSRAQICRWWGPSSWTRGRRSTSSIYLRELFSSAPLACSIASRKKTSCSLSPSLTNLSSPSSCRTKPRYPSRYLQSSFHENILEAFQDVYDAVLIGRTSPLPFLFYFWFRHSITVCLNLPLVHLIEHSISESSSSSPWIHCHRPLLYLYIYCWRASSWSFPEPAALPHNPCQ